MNLEEVARRAKVSTATVSRVLNKASLVKNSTRTRVTRAIEELKYHPNLHARSLAGGKSRSIGVIVSNIENPFFLDIYKAVEAGAHAEGYEVIMAKHRLSFRTVGDEYPVNDRPASGRAGCHCVRNGS